MQTRIPSKIPASVPLRDNIQMLRPQQLCCIPTLGLPDSRSKQVFV